MFLRNPARLLVVLSMLFGLLAVTPASGAAPEDAQPEAHPAYYVVQLGGPIEKSDVDGLRRAGADLLSYVPDFAYKARMTPAVASTVAGLAGVESVSAFPAQDKLAPDLAAEGVYRVRLERGADRVAALAGIEAAGVDVHGAEGDIIAVSGDLAAVEAVAEVADVAWVENLVIRETHNEYGAGAIVGANIANNAGYDGSTQIVAVADTGLGGGTAATAHPDIPAARITDVFDWSGTSQSGCYRILDSGAQDVDSGHGTHVAVSVLGDGNGSGLGKGTAPAAKLVFQAVESYVDFRNTCALFNPDGYYLLGIPEDMTPLLQQAYDEGARIHSDSWGSAVAGDYTADSMTVDSFIWENPTFFTTFSAGNAGIDANANGVIDNDSIGSPATAKNLLTVGASENDRQGDWSCDPIGNGCTGQNDIFTYGSAWPADYPANPIASDPSAGNAQQMAAFSSRGPTDDGRIKPDVVAPGTWVLSGYSDLYQQGYDGVVNPRNGAFQYDGWGFPASDDYKYMGGTSMSNPITAGGAAVVRDFYNKAHGHEASAALTKATLINSAVDLLDENNDGAADNDFPIPNNHEGWGRINVATAVDGSAEFVENTSGLVTGGSSTQTFEAVGGLPFKATLAWSDFPSTESASTNLVNDLDVTVTAPNGTVYRGNVFSGGWSTTGGSGDRVNNVENVYVQSAPAGTWTVTVSGFNVPFGPQPFALVVDGAPAGGGGNNPPVAGFSSSCTNLSCTFTDASTDLDGSIASWSWTFGDGGTSTATNPPHTYAASGTYTVSLTVTDDEGAPDTFSAPVTVTAPGGATTMHVGDLDGVALSQGRMWTAIVSVTVRDDAGSPVAGATVTGSFRMSAALNCVTNASGVCDIEMGGLRKAVDVFTVTNVTHGSLTYDPSDNTDPDGDSNGTSITVTRP